MSIQKVNTNKTTLILLIIVVLIAVGLFIYQSRIIDSLKKALEVSETQQLHVNLGALEGKINSGQGTLAVIKKGEEAIKYELEELKVKLNKTEDLLAKASEQKDALQQENGKLVKELVELKNELRLWQGQINNLDEKDTVLERRAKSVRELAKRIKDFKVKAQAKIDNIKMKLGNQGYIVKLGKTTFNRQNIVELERIIVTYPRAR